MFLFLWEGRVGYARNGGLERWLAPRLVRSFVRKGEARQKGRERSLLAFPACVHGTKRRSFSSSPPTSFLADVVQCTVYPAKQTDSLTWFSPGIFLLYRGA